MRTEVFENAEIEVVEFRTKDIITATDEKCGGVETPEVPIPLG